MTTMIGIRLKALREEQKLSQDDLARLFGFRDRQTVSAIETGERRLTAEELVLASKKLGKPLDYFTDPFQLAGEGRFSWRQTAHEAEQLRAFEEKAGRWIAAHRALAPQVGKRATALRYALRLAKQSSFENAMTAGDRFVAEFDLGDVPADRLADVMEQKLGILVLMVDPIAGISGAACRLPDLDAVLINRNEIVGRRNFDLAHELFHILTWDTMPPEHVEDATETIKSSRVEQLANNFAGAVLMPTVVIDRFGDWSGITAARLNEVASELKVTAAALKWRLVAAGKLSAAVAKKLPDEGVRKNGRNVKKVAQPALFSRPFMEVMSLAINDGLISLRRAAELLGVAVDDVSDLCTAYGLDPLDEL